MNTQHTPGPWHIKSSGIVGNTGFFQYCIAAENGRDILSTKEHVLGVTYAELEANARLIAAAPDLLDALQAILYWCQAPGSRPDPKRPEMIARAAIAKATGNAIPTPAVSENFNQPLK